MSLKARIVGVGSLSQQDKDQMWELFSSVYAEISRDGFEGDLARKEHVILLLDPMRVIQGFSTLVRWGAMLNNKPVTVIFSGDTVVAPRYWGQTALQVAFTRYVLATALKNPFQPTFWLLISKGWKTYLLLTRFFVRYWPRYDQPTPPEIAGLMRELAQKEWPDAYQPDQNILRFATAHGRLKDQVAPLTPQLLIEPDIGFFAKKNPGHVHGEELVCLGRVGLDFAVRTLWRVLSRPFRKRHAG